MDQRNLRAVREGRDRLGLGAQVVHVRHDVDKGQRSRNFHADMAPVGVRFRRNCELLRADHETVNPVGDGFVGEREADPAAVLGGLAVQVIVDLEHDVAGAGRKPHGMVVGQDIGIDAGCPAPDAPGFSFAAVVEEAPRSEYGKTGFVVPGIRAPRPARVVDEDVGVVNDALVARLELDGADGAFLEEFEGDDEVPVDVGTGRGNGKGLFHGENQVRFAGAPVGVRPHCFRERLHVLAQRRAGFGPCCEEGDLAFGKVPLVAEGTESLDGAPGRHDLLAGHEGQHAGPAFGIDIRIEREGGYTAVPVALRAVGCEQGSDIPVVGHGFRQAARIPALEHTADGRRGDGPRIVIRSQLRDGVLEVVAGDLVSQHADRFETVVDAAAVHDIIPGIDNEGLRGDNGVEAQGEITGGIEDDGKIETVLSREVPGFAHRQVGSRHDTVKRGAMRIGKCRKVVEFWSVAAGHWTEGVHEQEDHRTDAGVRSDSVNITVEIDHAGAVHMGHLAAPRVVAAVGGVPRCHAEGAGQDGKDQEMSQYGVVASVHETSPLQDVLG